MRAIGAKGLRDERQPDERSSVDLKPWRRIDRESRESTGATIRVVRLKLTERQLASLKSDLADGYSYQVLVKRFGVSSTTLRDRIAEMERACP